MDLIRCMALKCIHQEVDPINPGACTKRAPLLIPPSTVCELCNCPEFSPGSVYMDIRIFLVNHSVIIAATTLQDALRLFRSLPINPPDKGIYHELSLSTEIYDHDNIKKTIHSIILNDTENGGKLPLLVWIPK